MVEILSVDNMRKSDAATIRGGVAGKELMYRAGTAIFENVEWKPPVGIVCGVGNNAGDGYVLARMLSDIGLECTLILLEDRFSEDGRFYFERCLGRAAGISGEMSVSGIDNPGGLGGEKSIAVKHLEEFESFTEFGTLVDCICGTGFKGDVRGKARDAIDMINASGAYVVAVDINSGLNGDSGMCGKSETEGPSPAKDSSGMNPGCVVSDLTVSIGSYKPGHFLNMAKDVIKEKINADIGIEPVLKPYYLIGEDDLRPFFRERPNLSNKGTYGYVAIVGGSKKYSGALRLAAMANSAMRSGAGVVKVGLPNSLYHDLLPLILESTLFPLSDDDGELVFNEEEIKQLISNVKTVTFGMGIGVSPETSKCLEYLLKNYQGTLVVDADGLTVLSKMDRDILRRAKCKTVLTPHIKEFERLTGLKKDEILNSPVEGAETYALDTGAVVLLKGPSTVVTDGVRTYIVDVGCAGMATAGSGDVLSGILSAVCAYLPGSQADLTFAVAAGAFINGKAGELAQQKTNSVSMIASDTVGCIPEVISGLMETPHPAASQPPSPQGEGFKGKDIR